MMRAWRESPPKAFVIDLSRLPSQGREIAIALRQSPATRRIPIVFCEGAEEKVRRIRAELPDAVYCSTATLRSALKRAIAKPLIDPLKPTRMMDRYASRTVAQKLGIKENSSVALIDAPRDYIKVLSELPAGVRLLEEPHPSAAVTLCFVRDLHSLQRALSSVRGLASASKLWIVWPKGGSKASGIGEGTVREHALELGLVDYKICSVNEVWSAMLFAAREKTLRAYSTP
jgi:CheY-like chemotaxis protein